MTAKILPHPATKNLAFDHDGGSRVFLGEQIAERRPYSEETAREIDLEVKALVDDCYEKALELLNGHRSLLEKLAGTLEEEETLEGDALQHLLGDRPHGNGAKRARRKMTEA